ncbi:MAG: hypothetical protein E5X86_12525 [Mesorhizobium sp.]|uniref:hypothetical protein n=1 Tax=Mesorhizobium sp. TaxID=1871066 RepID=UPI000FE4FC55|nr:hypothetical protein [Mesorhizobium sp.]RWH88772.1 MAG: hypothetical protein EOQ87_20465 [Mesorhizobium sp.]RWH95629.1 MAG: hypothetical protein EOQ88_22595 [Mesorhizobium sp.]RWI01314.1 MAG: hypothetical protein EOQ89_16805 [Mesorhizobium sp.]TIO17237.1 MAG: hypothetical protein E5X86_12525 [Mesorhizobium sp.]
MVKSAAATNVEMIEVEGEVLDRVLANLSGTSPRTMVLTGTAGDGKTWHCRKAFTGLGGTIEAWNAGVGIAETRLPGGKTLCVIKDLSQFNGSPALPKVAGDLVESMLGRGDRVHLVAANDGQLLHFWRLFKGMSDDAGKIDAAVRSMLEHGTVRAPDLLTFDMHNLSRQHHDRQFELIVEAIVDHPDWSRCQGCVLLAEKRCAIRRNRALLADASAPATLRNRLKGLIRIAGANDTHLPMRHLLLLLVNVLLGVSWDRSQLLDCQRAHRLSDDKRNYVSNPYDNVLGLNLKAGEQEEYIAFTIFSNAGLGQETNNAIDALLLEQAPDELHRNAVALDPEHGARLFDSLRSQYRRGELQEFEFDTFQKAIETQRRRLFFALPSTDGDSDLDPWRLTVFRHGGQYLEFWDALLSGMSAAKTKSRLVKGLNRSYSGAMCDNDDSVWITGPAANTQSRIGRILDYEIPLGERTAGPVCFDFVIEGGRPAMAVKTRSGFKDPFSTAVAEPLTPLLFEYLMRVEGGSLPGSFSRQCYEELRQFRLRVTACLSKEDHREGDDLASLKIVRLRADGHLTSESLGVAVEA